jgi:hypothetical protein
MSANRGACALAIVAGAAAFLILLVANYPPASGIAIKTDADLHALGQGFYPVEQSGDLTFSWTEPRAEVRIPALDRRVEWRFQGRLKIWRPAGVPLPQVTISIDGAPAFDALVSGDMALDLAISRTDARDATITIETTPAFVPGGGDPRRLGVAIASMRIEPARERPMPPLRTAVNGALSIVILGTAVALLRLPVVWLSSFLILLAWCQAWLISRGLAAHLPYPALALKVAAGLGAGGVAAVWIVNGVRRQRLSAPALGAVTLSLGACYLKLLVLLHPSMPIGDGLFHAHRLGYVLAGRFYFTSMAPGDYLFPYPIFLYLVAAPFSVLTTDVLDRVALLRTISTVADAMAATLLYWMIVRATSNRLAGVASVAWYHLIPMTAWIMTWGNLTNAFGQTLFVASVAAVVALPVEQGRRGTVALLTTVAAAALLSHPSTCALLTAVLAATGGVYAWRGGPELRPAARGILLATAVAAAIAIIVYYAWFPAVYVSELSRVASDSSGQAAAHASSFFTRVADAGDLAARYFGWPAVVAAGVGAWRLAKAHDQRRFTLLLVAWAATFASFLLVGIFTPIGLRYHFATFPALAIVAGYGWAWAWQRTMPLRFAAAAVMGAAGWIGADRWMWMLSW